jgi:thiosulfate reductase / polysulfide reductase chain A
MILPGENQMIDNNNVEPGVETKKAICWASPGCSSSCGILVKVKEGKIIDMRGNPEFPGSQGAVCAQRFPHLAKWLDHPDQLKYPLKRKGERGENKWERISWDQALDEIAAKLKSLKEQYGAETLSVIEGTYRTDMYGIRGRFLNLFGNPQNAAAPGITCGCNKECLDIMLAGSTLPSMVRVLSGLNSPKCLVFCGTYLPEARVIAWRQIKKRLQADDRPKVIVIDPRRTEMADYADIYLQIRPGTDAALFMAWLNVIIEEGLYDREFIEQWTFGFEELKKRALEYPPEKVAGITWIPADKIRESARIYASAKPASITLGLASDHFGLNSIRVEQARICLHAVTGNMRAKYGETPTGPGPIIDGKMGIRDAMLQLEEKCLPEQRKKQLGSDRFKLMTWPAYEIISPYYKKAYGIPLFMCGHAFSVAEPVIWRSILDEKPYPTKALITWTSNPLLNAANTKLVYKALKSSNLELHVVLEHFMTPTALLADYVLPSASKLERGILSTTEDFTPFFRAGERAVPPLGERKHDYHFFRGLAQRLGFGEYFPWKDEEEFYDYRLAPLGITFKQAATEKYIIGSPTQWTYETINPNTGKPTGFATPSGKFELYSNVLNELGYDPLPFYEEPPESPVRTPEVAKEYPLILNTGGRFMPMFQSEHRQLGMGLREQHPDPLVEIHPDTAREHGLVEGDWAYIETLRGVIKLKVKISDRIHPRVINCEYLWWFPEQPAQEPWLHGLWPSNVNVLTMDDLDTCDPLTGGWPMRALLCKVYKVRTP